MNVSRLEIELRSFIYMRKRSGPNIKCFVYSKWIC